MASRESVVVIGLGRFGLSVARALSEHGHEVLGLDTDMRSVERAADLVTQAVQADGTDESVLVELGVRNFDVGVVAISSDIKSSILATLLLKRMGIPHVIAKAQEELHGEILAKVGANQVVYPNRDTGVRVAHSLTAPNLVDYMEITHGYGVAKMTVTGSMVGKKLGDLELKESHGLTPLILSHSGRTANLVINPSKYEVLAEGDSLLVSGKDDDLDSWRAN
ncbi:MAG: TrkA family potassium uptake protein [Chloroflexi bacterium]|nr:TrkA family potassium uptake protein [Chloroflexota bacterium]